MADRTSARIFGGIFQRIANGGGASEELVRDLWKMTEQYDFQAYQMESSESLIKLGLALECHGYYVYKGEFCDECEKSFDQIVAERKAKQ